jgi:cell filamentation protein
MAGRYKAEGPEAEFEAGSRGRVLRNRLGIKSVREIERNESEALLSATEQMIDETRIDQCFTPEYVRRMRRVWLGEIYVWAGEYRQVNMAKGSFMFAAANQVPKLMLEFGRGVLRDYTPCRFEDEGELATALAVVHAEFILIHPFREGNGRCGRLLAILMGPSSGPTGARLRRDTRREEE